MDHNTILKGACRQQQFYGYGTGNIFDQVTMKLKLPADSPAATFKTMLQDPNLFPAPIIKIRVMPRDLTSLKNKVRACNIKNNDSTR